MDASELAALLPRHKCGLYLEHNAYRDMYDTIEKAVEDEHDHDDWVSPEERQRVLETGEFWSLQWYPDTPVGFCRVVASTLEAVLAAANG